MRIKCVIAKKGTQINNNVTDLLCILHETSLQPHIGQEVD